VTTPADAVLAANRAFYEAFEARDLDAMADVWERSERTICTHPGWAVLRGWARVGASFFALFQSPDPLQFILTNESAEVVGDVAWVTVDENLLVEKTGGGTVSALNVFVRDDGGRWRMVAHHASTVSASLTE
jgi:ketosteroid isomerase-like protein